MNSHKRDKYKRKIAKTRKRRAYDAWQIHRLKEDIAWLSKKYGFEYSFDELDSPAQSLQSLRQEIKDEILNSAEMQQIKRDVANQAFDMMVEATNKAFMPHIEGVRAVFLNNLVKDGE